MISKNTKKEVDKEKSLIHYKNKNFKDALKENNNHDLMIQIHQKFLMRNKAK